MQTQPAQPGANPEQVQLAAKVFLYGYTLVYNLHEIGAFVAGSPRLPVHAPYNQLTNSATYANLPGQK